MPVQELLPRTSTTQKHNRLRDFRLQTAPVVQGKLAYRKVHPEGVKMSVYFGYAVL